MSLYKKFKTDQKAEAEGILFTVTDQFRVRLARVGGENKKYTLRMNELMKPYRRVDWSDLDEKIKRKISLQVICETVILPGTWQTWVEDKWVDGIQNANDEIVPATAENYKQILNDLPDLLDDLVTEARSMANYRQSALEAEAKNSQTS